jgi:hypothetical protein
MISINKVWSVKNINKCNTLKSEKKSKRLKTKMEQNVEYNSDNCITLKQSKYL